MNIAIIGTGYVGLVTGTCFAEIGNNVICVDKDKNKIKKLKKSLSPVYEPALEELIVRNVKEGRLSFSADAPSAIKKSKIVFNCVGTPLGKNGLPDLRETFNVAGLFARNLCGRKIFVNKSTVPVGTTGECKKIMEKELGSQKNRSKTEDPRFMVISNPEFLRQGTAVKDFMTPDRIIVGTESEAARKIMEKLYSPIVRTGKPAVFTDLRTSELIKYAANAFIATKISFINEMAAFCEKTGIDIREISRAIGMDGRIGPRYLHAGIGYGGGCLTKDIISLISLGKKHHHDFTLLNSVSNINSGQRKLLVKKIKKTINPKNKIFAVWGVSYKPKTDDLRDSPAVEIIRTLNKEGATLHLFDPVALENAKKIFPVAGTETKNNIKINRSAGTGFKYFTNSHDAAKNADALLILTEWDEFRSPDYKNLKKTMRGNLIFDGRNILNAAEARTAGFEYFGIGTVESTPENKQNKT